jgi:hypothetical protein
MYGGMEVKLALAVSELDLSLVTVDLRVIGD